MKRRVVKSSTQAAPAFKIDAFVEISVLDDVVTLPPKVLIV